MDVETQPAIRQRSLWLVVVGGLLGFLILGPLLTGIGLATYAGVKRNVLIGLVAGVLILYGLIFSLAPWWYPR